MPRKTKLDKRVAEAVRHFWTARGRQDESQGGRTGQRDRGNRTAATGGKQLDGFVTLIRDLLVEHGLPEASVYCCSRRDVTLPGFFRPTKQWDVVVVANDALLASIECKALCGPSFGNNYNNRVEEAIGSAADVWTAFREGLFGDSPRPFLGYVLLLEDAPASQRPVAVCEQYFSVAQEFQRASYARRCEESMRRLVRERCYDAAALIISQREDGVRGKYQEPASDLNFERFTTLLCPQALAGYQAVMRA